MFLLVEEPTGCGDGRHAHGDIACRIPDVVPNTGWERDRIGEKLHDEDRSTPYVEELFEVNEILVTDGLNPRKFSRELKVRFGVVLPEQLQSDPFFGLAVPCLIDLAKSSTPQPPIYIEPVEAFEYKTRVCETR
jgi:hypothetical protein